MLGKTVVKKKTHEMIKEELLNSLRQNDQAEETEINAANITDPIEVIELINRYEEIIKTQHERVIGSIFKQGQILKNFKKTENFFDNAGQSRSMIYFKIGNFKIKLL